MMKNLKRGLGAFSVLMALVLVVSGCGQSSSASLSKATTASTSSNSTAKSEAAPVSAGATMINYGTTEEPQAYMDLTVVGSGVKLGSDGKTHDAFLPATFVLEKGVKTQITIRNYDEGPHTLTIPDLGINININGRTMANVPSVTTAVVTANKTGTFKWQCELPCDGKANGWAMTQDGYMRGTMKVVDDNKQYVYSTVVGSGVKLGWDGKTHDAFLPANYTFIEGKPVVMQFANYDEGPHTFTVSELGINFTVPGAKSDNVASVTTFTFTPKKSGVFKWVCALPCDSKANGWAMQPDVMGYMSGTVTVAPAASDSDE